MASLTQSTKFWSAGVFCRSHQAFNPAPKGLSINKQTLHLNGQHFCIWKARDPVFKFQYRGQLSRPSCFASFLSCASPITCYTCSLTHPLQSTAYKQFHNMMRDNLRQLKRHIRSKTVKIRQTHQIYIVIFRPSFGTSL
jgi:hypothetical protein